MNVSKFVNDHIALCVCTLGIAILGYMGYHAVQWLVNKCQITELIDFVAQNAMIFTSSAVSSSNTPITNPEILHVPQETQIAETTLRQESEHQKTLAATKIQSFVRGHLARSLFTQLQAEKLERQRSTIEMGAPLRDPSHSEIAQVEPILERPIAPFVSYTVNLKFPDGRIQAVNINQFTDVEMLIEILITNVNSNHTAIELCFDRPTSDRKVAVTMESFQKISSATVLQFSICKYDSRKIIIQPNPIESENLGEGIIRQIYANGVIEEFALRDRYYEGTRIFPDGKKERGEFQRESGKLSSGYRIEIDGRIEFIRPKSFASYKIASEKKDFEICDFEEQLVVLERTFGEDYQSRYAITEISIEDTLLKSSQRPFFGDGNHIKDILLHESFSEKLRGFIEHILAADESGASRLFSLSNFAALDVIEIGSKIIDINPLEIRDPVSGRNFITQAAHLGSAVLLNNLIKLFPREFLAIGQCVIAELLTQTHFRSLVSTIVEELRKLGGVLDTFHSLWVQVTQSTEIDETFIEQFDLLSTEQKRTLYDSAFAYNNPFIHEPSDPPVTAEQYSINLMWINKNRMPEDQEFLFGNGLSFEERELDFNNRFIKPVSEWAKTNPGSPINIWIDSEMATPSAIERSRIALETALEGTSHGIVQFRDVRSIDVVRSNPLAFSERIPVYFRVDLLRAIAADYTLREKETKFFVYGDIDMKPLSTKELFDKRTVDYLNDFGFVMAKGGFLGFENGFQILNGDNPQLMDSHRKVIIDLSIEMTLESPEAIKEQQIYDTYPAMITHFLDADGRYGKFDMEEEEEGLDKLSRFRYDRFRTSAHHNLPLGEKKIALKGIMPRKPVRLPPSHF